MRPAVSEAPRTDGAERRQLTVMFCDLVGSTELTSRLDPEDMREVLGAYHKCVAETIGRYGGFVARSMGDGVLVYFGYPKGHEVDAERAVRSGLALIEAVRHLQTHERLEIRIGIGTGLVVVGSIVGVGEAQEWEIVGETPNLAARLQALAEPNTVVIGPNTRRLLGHLFEYRALGAIELKGFAEPVQAYQVLRPSAMESRFEALHSADLTPLIGRQEEIGLLSRRWAQAKGGSGRVVLISAEAGIGKSRLTEAFRDRLGGEPYTPLRYFCSPHHQDSALFPFIGQLERAAGFERDDTPSARLDKLEALVAPNVPVAGDVPLLAELLAVPFDNRYPALDLTPLRKKEKTLEALLHHLSGLASGQPVLMIFEDLHWADPTSRELLDLTVAQIVGMPVLLIATFRPEVQLPWTGQPHVATLSLRRLGRDESDEVVRAIIGNAAVLSGEIVDEIVERTDGVPLFLEELTKAVLETASAGGDEGRKLVSSVSATSLAVPATLQASLMARLDRLGPSAKEIAQVGAVIGREFSYELLVGATQPTQAELRVALSRLVEAGLVFQHGAPPQATFLFKHTLVRDTAYGTLLRGQRQTLHVQVGTALEKDFPEMVETQPEILAHHFTEGGLAAKAVGYWLRAGKNATNRSANLEAIGHLRRGIEAVGRLPAGAPRDRLELDLQFVLGPCLIATRGPIADAALVTFERARELCEQLQGPPEHLNVLYWLAVMRGVRGELREADEATGAGIDLAKMHGDQPALINFLRGSALALILMGRPAEALARTEEAVATFDSGDERTRIASRAAGQDAGAAGRAVMAWALWFLGYPDGAIKQMAAALDRADEIAHPHTQAYSLYYASILYALRRESTTAHLHAERCLSLSERHGFGLWRNLARIACGICTSLLDPSSAKLEELRAELDDHGRRGQRMGITALYALLCRALIQHGRPDAVLDTVDEVQKIAGQTNELLFEAEFCRAKARAFLIAGPPGAWLRAQTILEHALAVARSQRARSIELLVARDLADLWGKQGNRGKARELLAPIHGWFTEGFDTPDLKEAKALLDELG
ncbi:MAG TPA: adenylate/guanylate cyclase domain-containing protein [Stellaceae bacterium]|nr:adenylate/guanylate cyclase domain-containing protein [Stellaceae bacterium]